MSPIRSSLLLGAGDAAAGGFQVSRSLRYSSGDSSFCSRTPSVAGNRKTWTWSGWVKRSGLGQDSRIFSAATSGSNQAGITFNTDDTIEIFDYQGSYGYRKTTTQVFRDASAWYHFCLVADFDNATAEDRLRFFVNGVRVTVFSTNTNPSSGYATGLFNSTIQHGLGAYSTAVALLNAYLANVQFIDGQALTPSSFTEVSATTGQLIPKAYSGNYGIVSVAAATGGLPIWNTTDTYGAAKGSGTRTDASSSSIVLALPMDGTNGGTSFGDQSAVIKGSGSAKTVTVNGNTNTSTTQSKFYGSSGSFDGTGDYLSLSSSADFQIWNSTSWTIECFIYINSLASSFYFFGAGDRASTTTRVMFSVNSSGNFILDWDGTSSDSTTTFTTGLSASKWYHLAVVSNGTTCKVYINGTQASTTATLGTSSQANAPISIGVPGLAANPASYNGLNGYVQDFRIYKGVAKYTSDFATVLSQNNSFYLKFDDNSSNTASTLGKDTSGNSNNWTPNNLSVTAGTGNDSLVDSPTSYGTDTGAGGEVRGNYATLNPLAGTGTLANGNLDATGQIYRTSTIGLTSSKWYCEIIAGSIVVNSYVGIFSNPNVFSTGYVVYGTAGGISTVGGTSNISSFSMTEGDIFGMAFDRDASTLAIYKNGTLLGQFSGISLGSDPWYLGVILNASATNAWTVNFGQRAFAYTAPSGFKALCDTNLPTPVVAKPNTLFDTKIYTGNGGTQTISGLAFSPDFVWIKCRSSAEGHALMDVVRGSSKRLFSELTDAEDSTATLSSFDSNGFSVSTAGGSSGRTNASSQTFAGWCWDAGTSTVSNTQGSITSQVRANTSAGFSVVTYTGNLSGNGNVTVGHGLGVAPQLIITKARSTSSRWAVQMPTALTANYYLELNSTSAQAWWGTQTRANPTSTVFDTIYAGGVNESGVTYVAYCFAPVSGYASVGSYVGNGSSDGVFVYTGFRPRFILVKNATSAYDWRIHDTARDTYNVAQTELFPNGSYAEAQNSAYYYDILSNGFKLRTSDIRNNGSGDTYIYYAVAENPFQYARAR